MTSDMLIIPEKETKQPNILLQFIVILIAAIAIARLASPQIWANHSNLCHAMLELTCIFIAVVIFLVVWFTYERSGSGPYNHLIGFGFVAVAVFNIFHVIYYPDFNLYPDGRRDLTLYYWTLSSFAEGIMLLIGTLKLCKARINKWVGLTTSLVSALGISYLILFFPERLPLLATENAVVTPVKTAFEYFIIAIFIVVLWNTARNSAGTQDAPSKYIILAVMFVVLTELCSTLPNALSPFFSTFRHILKIISYFFLFRGIFVNAVTFPYDKLEHSQKYLNSILNGLPLGLITYNSDFRLSFANLRAREILGCEHEDIKGLSTAETSEKFYTENSRHLPDNSLEAAGQIFEQLGTVKNKCGEPVRLDIDVQRLEPGGFLYIFDEAAKAEQLENLVLQTRPIFSSLSNPVVIFDRNKEIIWYNRGFLSATEMNTSDILGISSRQLLKSLKFSKKKLPSGTLPKMCPSRTFEISVVTPKGTKKELILHASSILSTSGKLMGYIAIASDITAANIAKEKLRQQEKLVVLGQMAAGIVHEIRNPLTTIQGFTQLIQAKTAEQSTREFTHIIQGSVGDVNRVVTDFLSFAKPCPCNLKPVSLTLLMNSLRLMLETHSFMQGVDISLITSPGEKMVLADESQIKQVILNIVKNAIEAMSGTKTPKLLITTGIKNLTEEMFIKITDNGRGMTSEEKIRLGTPFFTTKDTGTGLGLSICYQIIREHGGRIEVESSPGKGTTFSILLPYQDITQGKLPGVFEMGKTG
ncbi:MASE3 domain-containing protein [Phosphitispora fastidiosa]|uniref:MASE3 domain-containing protein n=1 Tax=Phosphitispora fastidiosa TaxID=2837202 RepID=UPI001E288CC7|nr:MASE3 domain-containing protein [Phosphitispora fastidiosa]MBU7007411.1 signal transduction histidine kinase [Phosphitispora fastidiosa]